LGYDVLNLWRSKIRSLVCAWIKCNNKIPTKHYWLYCI